MLRFAADENFNNDIVRGLLRREPDLDILRIQDVNLSGADDAPVLEWCAKEGRVLLTHDVSTITRFAYDRVREGKGMPGYAVIGCPGEDSMPLGKADEPTAKIETRGSVLAQAPQSRFSSNFNFM